MNDIIDATAYDKDGNIITCSECPKKAGFSIVGLYSSLHLCDDHSPYANDKDIAKFVYRPPLKDEE